MKPDTQLTDKPEPTSTVETIDIEARLSDLRRRINQAGQQIDEYKAKTAAAMGGGVFLGLLAGVAGYDLAIGKAGVWMAVGLTRPMLVWLALAFGAVSLILLTTTGLRHLRRDHQTEQGLAELEEELAGLLEHTDAGSRLSKQGL